MPNFDKKNIQGTISRSIASNLSMQGAGQLYEHHCQARFQRECLESKDGIDNLLEIGA